MNPDLPSVVLLQMPWRWHDGGHVSMHWGLWLLWLALLLLIAWLLVRSAARGTSRGSRSPQGSPGESAEEALRRRFAEGEMEEEEFQRRMKTLKGSRE